MKYCAILFLLAALVSIQTAAGDIFRLQSGGEIHGALAEPQKSAEAYLIDTVAGGQISVARSQVKAVVRQSKDEAEYDRIRPKYSYSVADQWKLAEWCRERSLT